MLTAEGVAVEPHPWLPDCLFLNGTGSLEHLEAFQKGYFYIQDAAAHLAVDVYKRQMRCSTRWGMAPLSCVPPWCPSAISAPSSP